MSHNATAACKGLLLSHQGGEDSMAEITSSDIPVLPWPAVPTPTPTPTPGEVYKHLSEQAREYPNWLEANVQWRDVGKKPNPDYS